MSSPTYTIAAPPAPRQPPPACARAAQPAPPVDSATEVATAPPASFGNALTRLYAGLVLLR
ncbi:hypothetical protein [Massilia sp. YMA4]|uniref:hypothetical protein n=1 Tax=Massilia sp. YMA4 TaxID=1593482 RepID=UPI000DD134BF|nr:hypothetical protein [Massilia sp. YMA4]AXA90787.1 hypothetical protein DPH57_06160 [Massilia sp. YMA4]